VHIKSLKTATNRMSDPVRLPPEDSLLVIGKSSQFSPCMCRTLATELPDWQVHKVANVSDVPNLQNSTLATFQFAILYQDIFLDDPNSAEYIKKMLPDCRMTLAYNMSGLTDLADTNAMQVFDSFIPLDVKVDVWISATKLTLVGGTYWPPEFHGAIFENGKDTIENISSQSLATKPMASLQNDLPLQAGWTSPLTPRENEVLRLVSEGRQNKLIAAELNLSEHTIKLHLHHIITKLSVSNRTEAARWYMDHMA
jgi:DNA-binding NarL/FixJ family response regulator